MYNKVRNKSTTDRKLYHKSATNRQSTVNAVQQIDTYNKSTTNVQQIEQLYSKSDTFTKFHTLCCTTNPQQIEQVEFGLD